MRYLVMPSPVGPLTLAADTHGLTAVYFERHRHGPSPVERADWIPGEGGADPASRVLAEAREQLTAYFGGALREFDLPLAPSGTPFQERVWNSLREIPFGEVRTYGALARRIGRSGAARAVGAANGRNPISIVVPCHRVVGADGSLTGFGGGIERKRWLLEHEARVVGRGPLRLELVRRNPAART